MTSITDIPIHDAKLFLSKNDLKIPINDDKIYSHLKDIIQSGREIKYYPDSIIDWMIASNLVTDNKNIYRYKEEEINSLSYDELKDLAHILELDYNQFKNKIALQNSVVNILFYLGKLDRIKRNYFELTPSKEVNMYILSKRDLHDIINDFTHVNDVRSGNSSS